MAGERRPDTVYGRLAEARQGGLKFLDARCSPAVAQIRCITSTRAVTKTLHNCFVSAVNFVPIPLEHCTK